MYPISQFKVIFWDFDGVIKDSVEVKTEAFVNLFKSYGDAIGERVREHHEANGGMSRFVKFPIYLSWVNEEATQHRVDELSNQFNQLVFSGVVNSEWVPGVEAFLRDNKYKQDFVVVSATPQGELEQIIAELKLTSCFKQVFGSPKSKKEAIAEYIQKRMLKPSDCLMIGDATADMEAAEHNAISFLLRRNQSNKRVFQSFSGPSINDFNTL